jgi:osmoprotectant transport system permease protein
VTCGTLRLGLRHRLWLTPVVLAGTAAAVVFWAQRGSLDAGEAAVLSGANLALHTREHLVLSAVSTALAVAVAVPAGIAVTRPTLRRLAPPVLFVANVGQTVPTVAVLALMFTVTGIGFRTAVLGLWAYSLLPVLRNTLAGLDGVDPAVVEAARGMGMSPAQVLARVELPLAWPVLVAGIRTATVVNVGTAALATFVGAGGLGAVIQVGIDNQRDRILLAGASLTALLALAADWAVATLAALTPGGRITGLQGGEQQPP